MFSELPKLFERNFAMAYFLPSVIFISLSILILDQYQLTQILLATDFNALVGSTLLGLSSWLGGILLLATNRDLYRLMEGYGKYNPLKLISGLQKRRFHALNNRLNKLDDEYRQEGSDFPIKKRMERNEVMRELAEHFPDDERWLLPTSFGNTLRAFEIYPRVMYGIEAIDGWSRILAVIPEGYQSLIDNAKAQVDFWVNFGFVSALLLIEYLGITYYHGSLEALWLVSLIITALLVAPYRAKRVAVEWGDLVKSVFDLYRFKLIELLNVDEPTSRENEVEIFTKFSQAIVYRIPYVLPNLKGYEVKDIDDLMTDDEQISVGGNLRGNLISGDGNVIYVNTQLPGDSSTNAPLPVKKRKSSK